MKTITLTALKVLGLSLCYIAIVAIITAQEQSAIETGHAYRAAIFALIGVIWLVGFPLTVIALAVQDFRDEFRGD